MKLYGFEKNASSFQKRKREMQVKKCEEGKLEKDKHNISRNKTYIF